MKEVVGVRFRPNGRIYYFDPGDFHIEAGTDVIVETVQGVEFGTCVQGRTEIEEENRLKELKPILRVANDYDRRQIETNKRKSQEAFDTCVEKIKEHNLDMKLISAEYTFDGNKVLFYFTADGRVDFRELVRDLAGVFKTRIELRQIGVRDEAKMSGGIGMCGRELCCNSYLPEFVPVSIKMAKEQNLSLNPTKISGVCGRLMCCLKYEQETYEYLNSKMPGVGDEVTTLEGVVGKVDAVNVMRQTVRIIITDEEDNKTMEEHKVDELKFKPRKKKDKHVKSKHEKELEALEALELSESTNRQDASQDAAIDGGAAIGNAGGSNGRESGHDNNRDNKRDNKEKNRDKGQNKNFNRDNKNNNQGNGQDNRNNNRDNSGNKKNNFKNNQKKFNQNKSGNKSGNNQNNNQNFNQQNKNFNSDNNQNNNQNANGGNNPGNTQNSNPGSNLGGGSGDSGNFGDSGNSGN